MTATALHHGDQGDHEVVAVFEIQEPCLLRPGFDFLADLGHVGGEVGPCFYVAVSIAVKGENGIGGSRVAREGGYVFVLDHFFLRYFSNNKFTCEENSHENVGN